MLPDAHSKQTDDEQPDQREPGNVVSVTAVPRTSGPYCRGSDLRAVTIGEKTEALSTTS
jgi:hypothetical protein